MRTTAVVFRKNVWKIQITRNVYNYYLLHTERGQKYRVSRAIHIGLYSLDGSTHFIEYYYITMYNTYHISILEDQLPDEYQCINTYRNWYIGWY